jgi:hypothetical protein
MAGKPQQMYASGADTQAEDLRRRHVSGQEHAAQPGQAPIEEKSKQKVSILELELLAKNLSLHKDLENNG